MTGNSGLRARLEKWLPSIYFVVGQGIWFALVMSAARGLSAIGILSAIAGIAAHLAWVRRPAEELKLIAVVTLIGGCWDSALAYAGVLHYPRGALFENFAPLWILALWAMFAAQFNTTYQWLKKRLWAAALLGGIAGPLSFRAGSALGAVQFTDSLRSPAVLAVGWAMLLPLVTVLSRRWDGVQKH